MRDLSLPSNKLLINKLYINRPRFPPGSWRAYSAAAAIALAALALRLLLDPWLARVWVSGVPFVTFFPGVIIAAFLCGSAAAFLSAGIAIAAAWLVILPPGAAPLSAYQTAMFSIGIITVIALVAVMRAASANIRRLNEVLRISEGKFRSLLESAPDAMVIIDEQCRIALINARTESLFGYSREALHDKPIELLIAERDREKYRTQLAAFAAGASPGTMIALHGTRKDGSDFPFEISLGLVSTEAGRLVSNAVRDITARREIEASLAEASQAKSDFLARMSHELRTPLNAIIGFSEMIHEALIGPLDARYREYGADIFGAGRHLQKIINDILDISKVEGGRLELRDEPVALSDAIEECRRIVAAMAHTAGVALAIEVPPSLPLIRLDSLRFRQILLNLMSNAVKFTPAGGRVTVSAAIAADGIAIAVEDTGIGMKADDIAVALEPFRQIDGALSRRFDGTGLGLPLAKALVELHGGTLDIESAPGVGTAIRIRLPPERVVSIAA